MFLLTALIVMWPMFGPGSPPGVDAPTFLHLSWMYHLAFTGQLDSLFLDPYWYGGFPYVAGYGPFSFLLIGGLSTITPVPIEIAYRIFLFLAYVGLGLSTYVLALEFEVRRPYAMFAGLLAMLSYPAFLALGTYGWYTTLVGLPFGILGLTFAERALRLNDRRWAAVAGIMLAILLLSNHHSGFAFGAGMVGWALARTAFPPTGPTPFSRWRMVQFIAITGGTAFLIVSPWFLYFLSNALEVRFEREVAGNWSVPIDEFRARIFDRSHIGKEGYPTYWGIAQVSLGLCGLIYAAITRLRAVAVASFLLVALWFAAGQQVNPLINIYPLSGFDLARFFLFLMPLFGLYAAIFMEAIVRSAEPWLGRPRTSAVLRPAALGLGAMLILAIPIADAVAARPLLEPMEPPDEVWIAMDWLGSETPEDAAILAVGMQYRPAWWVPLKTGRAVMDGWSDEGASSWRLIREVRMMGWSGRVDTVRLHEIMGQRNTNYLVIAQWLRHDSPWVYEEEVSGAPHL
ncbi:MAG: hypothetical protein WD533_06795, partial [Dehalococcoidia bacterium]